MTLLSQTWTVIVMNILSMPRRLWMSLAAILAVAVVVAVLMSFLSMSNGFKETLAGTGSESVAIVTRSGSQSEINSVVAGEYANIIATAEGIAKDANGNPIYSPELYVIVDGLKKGTLSKANLPMRGISLKGFTLRDRIDITAGRLFEPGKNEIIVGQSILSEFTGFELGKKMRFGKSEWEVVGVFSTGGSAFESELWTDARVVQSQFQRGNSFQTVRLRLETPGDITGLQKLVDNDPRLQMDVQTEKAYYSEQGEQLESIVSFGWGLSIIMAAGALAGALNTMYTSVSARTQEIATLRAIGFSNISAFFGTLAESLVLAMLGGLVGALASYLFMDGLSASTMSASFTQVVFTFEMSPILFRDGAVLALGIGLVGGFFPAWHAARMPVIAAFRGGA